MLKTDFLFYGRFVSRLTRKKKSMKQLLTYIAVAVILHILLVGFGNEGEVGNDEVMDMDKDNELNRAIPNGDGNAGGLCCEQLKNFIMENYHV
jgi:hypothetical protein